jgi:hypothetical protein
MSKRFSPHKGFYGEKSDDEAFLRPDNTDPYKASASGHGYQARFDDDAGTRDLAGSGIDGSDDLGAFLSPSFQGDVDHIHERLNALIDNDPSLPNGGQLAGGGPLGHKHNVQPGRPRFAPKTAPVRNRESRGGVDRSGRR